MDGPDLPGRILTFQEKDYRFGRGVLRIQIMSLGGVEFRDDGVDWIRVSGLARAWNGAPAGQRTVYIRADKLEAARRG